MHALKGINRVCRKGSRVSCWPLNSPSSKCQPSEEDSSSTNTCFDPSYPSFFRYTVCPFEYKQWGDQKIVFDNDLKAKNITVTDMLDESVCIYRFSRTKDALLKGITIKIHSASSVDYQIFHNGQESWDPLACEFKVNKISHEKYIWVTVLSNSANSTVTIEANLSIVEFSLWVLITMGVWIAMILILCTSVLIVWSWIFWGWCKKKLSKNRNNNNQIELPGLAELGHPQLPVESQVGLAQAQDPSRSARINHRRTNAYRDLFHRARTDLTAWNSEN